MQSTTSIVTLANQSLVRHQLSTLLLLLTIVLLFRPGVAIPSYPKRDAPLPSYADNPLHPNEYGRCEPLKLTMCRSLNLYNRTRMPNFFQHESQDDAGLEVNQFWPLVKVNCSDLLGFFLCSLYAPVCMEGYEKPLRPCRSVCQAARSGCEPVMGKFGFAWPEQLACDNFQPYQEGGEELCMEPPKLSSSRSSPASKGGDDIAGGSDTFGDHSPGKSRIKPIQDPFDSRIEANSYPGGSMSNYPLNPIEDLMSDADILKFNNKILGFGGQCRCSCKAPFRVVDPDYQPHRKVYVGNISNCANPCQSAYFSSEELNFGVFWIGLWSILCCISTLVTVATFLIDTERFRYPERSIVFMSLCYLMMSIGFLIRLVAGHEEVACDRKLNIVRAGRTESPTCTVVFILIYLFGMASCVWWVILTLTWFLSAGLKWSNEAIAKYAQYFHAVAWTIPAVKSIAIVATSSVDGDPVSGICYVGNTSILTLRIFVLGPLFIYLVLGSFFLLAGFISLIRIRHIMVKQQGKDTTEKLKRLMVRIGMFSVLYTLPATMVIGCHFYEEHYREHWEMSQVCDHCLKKPEKPEFVVFMIKYCMLLIVGVTPILWIWSKKTLVTWQNFFSCLCGGCCRKEQPMYQPAEAIIAVRSHTDVSSAYNTRVP